MSIFSILERNISGNKALDKNKSFYFQVPLLKIDRISQQTKLHSDIRAKTEKFVQRIG